MSSDIRLIIADDEALVRERIRHGFPLKEYGYEIVGEAEDGEEALELCEKLSTDIVITDIVMPRMDGLELTRRLQKDRPHIKVIILSNYREFEFACQAISYGATGYMLKVSSGYQELLSLLEVARKEIERDREKIVTEINARQHLQQNIPLLRKQFIMDLINQKYYPSEEIKNQFDYLNMHQPLSGLSIAIIQIDQYTKIEASFHQRDLSLFKYSLMNIVEELSNKIYKSNVFYWNENELVLLLHLDLYSLKLSTDCKLEYLLKNIKSSVSGYLPFTISISCSNQQTVKTKNYSSSIQEALRESMKEALLAMKERFYIGHDSINFLIQKEYTPMDNQIKEQFKNELLSLNKASEEAVLRQSIREGVIRIITDCQLDPMDITSWLEDLASDLFRTNPSILSQISHQARTIETITDLEHILYQLIVFKNSSAIYSNSSDTYRDEIEKALNYVFSHYHTPLSITNICEQIHMSPNYFSYIFKKETGMNFSDHLTNYRIQQAMRLLCETSLQIQEIAERVGIPDYKYFARLFRKTTGQTPGSYRTDYKTKINP